MLFKTLAALGVIFIGAARVSGEANDTSFDPVSSFCRRFNAQSAVIGERLYVDGGGLNINNKGAEVFTNTHLVYYDLSTTFRNGSQISLPILWANLSKPSTVPSVNSGNLWPDQANAYLYLYGGEYPNGTNPPSTTNVWRYDVYYNNWTMLPDPDTSVQAVSHGANTALEFLGKAYTLGGWMNNRTTAGWDEEPLALNTLLQYDFIANQWTNMSRPADGLGRAEGVLLFVPAGDNGLLVHFGGVWVSDGNSTAAPMKTIDVYDIASTNWYQQNTTGDIPNNRRQFGAGIVSADDGSSHNVYIYGGMGFGKNASGFDDIYILSMPSFTWTKVYPPTGTEEHPHYGMTANVVNNQMLVIGGQFPEDPNVSTCDTPTGGGAHNMRLSKDQDDEYWGAYLVNKTSYRVPNDITDVIGGTGVGAATVESPKAGWSSSDLNTLFSRSFTAPVRSPTRSAPTPQSNHHSNHIAAIVAPTVICGTLLLAALGAFFYLRRYKQTHHRYPWAKARVEGTGKHSYEVPPEGHGPPTPGTPGTWNGEHGDLISPVTPEFAHQPGPPQYEINELAGDAKIELPAMNTEPVELPDDASLARGGAGTPRSSQFREHGVS